MMVPVDAELPKEFRLDQNYPNPFNPQTTIAFDLPRAGRVTLSVYDALGREVALLVSEMRPAGRHQLTWNASALPSGIYFYRLTAGAFSQTKALTLLK